MAEITINEVELKIAGLPGIQGVFSQGVELRELALLFAILKVGQSVKSLVEYTGYPPHFVLNMVTHLSQRGLLMPHLSPNYVLKECPGSHELIALVTGARPYLEQESQIIRQSSAQSNGAAGPKDSQESISGELEMEEKMEEKPEVMAQRPVSATVVTSHEDAFGKSEEECWCGRKLRHTGLHLKPGERGKSGRLKRHTKTGKKANPVASKPTREKPVIMHPAVRPVTGQSRHTTANGNGSAGASIQAIGLYSEKKIEFAGGHLALSLVGVDLLTLKAEDREFVFGLTDMIDNYLDRFKA
jgi:hypothetical protein